MAFRKPITTLGGTTWWNNIRQNELFIMQEHKVGLPVWPYKFRIIMRENRMESKEMLMVIPIPWSKRKKLFP